MHLKHEIRETGEDYVKAFFFFSVKVFSTKVLIGDNIFTSPTGYGNGTSIFTWSSEPCKGPVEREYLS